MNSKIRVNHYNNQNKMFIEKETKKNNVQKQPKPCKFGLNCKFIIKNSCRDYHSQKQIQIAKQFQSLTSITDAILCYGDKPILIGGDLLQLKILPSEEIELTPGNYYNVWIQLCQRHVVVEVKNKICSFGDLKGEVSILKTFQSPFRCQLVKINSKFMLIGKCKIKNGYKYISSQRRFDIDLQQKINENISYPILKDTIVKFEQVSRNKINVQSLQYPKMSLFGILQLKGKGLTFVPYDNQIDQMSVCQISDQIKQLVGLKYYSFLLKINDQDNLLNNKLKNFHVRGKLFGWPSQSLKPIIELLPQIYENSTLNIKQSILFANGIQGEKFSKEDLKQSDKLIQKMGKQNHKNRVDYTKLKIFTVDSSSTKIFDDAFSIQKLDNCYLVGIHIADVAQVVAKKSSLDKSAKKKNSTLYIKNYHFPMLPDKLGKKISLKQKQEHLACSLFFKINDDGLIDMSSLKLQETIINVADNYSYYQFDQLINKEKDSIESILYNIISKRSQLRQTKLIEGITKAQDMVQNLMIYSAELINYLLTHNMTRITSFKNSVQEKVQEYLKDQTKFLLQIEKQKSQVFKLRKQCNKAKIKLQKLKKDFQKELKAKKQKLKKKLMAQYINKKQKTKNKKMKDLINGQQDQSQNITQSELDNQLDQTFVTIEGLEAIQKQLQGQQNDKKLIQELLDEIQTSAKQKVKKVTQESQSQQQIVILGQKVKISAAQRAKYFIQKIFAYFKLQLDCSRSNTIISSFKKLIQMKPHSTLFRDYLQKLKIRNYQYFPYFVDKKQNKQKQSQKLTQGTKNQSKKSQNKKNVNKKYVIKSQAPQQSADKQLTTPIQKLPEKEKVKKDNDIQKKQQPSKKNKGKNQRQRKNKNGQSKDHKNNIPKQNSKQEHKKQSQCEKNIIKPEIASNDQNLNQDDKIKQVITNVSEQKQKQIKTDIEINTKKPQTKQKKERRRNNKNHKYKPIEQNIQKKQTFKSQIQDLKDQTENLDNSQKNTILQKKQSQQQTQTQEQQIKDVSTENNIKSNLASKIVTENKIENDILQTKNQQQPKKIQEDPVQKQMKKEIEKNLKQLQVQEVQHFKKSTQKLSEQIKQFQSQQKTKLMQLVDSIKKIEEFVILFDEFDKNDFIVNKKLVKMVKIIKDVSKFACYKLPKIDKSESISKIIMKLYAISMQSLSLNKQSSNKQSVESFNELQKYQYLGWNNPIRQYSCLMTQRLLKQYKWFFQGQLDVTNVVQHYYGISSIKQKKKQILKWNKERILTAETKKNVKTANFTIEKVQFIQKIKNNPDQLIDFLIITSNGNYKNKAFHTVLDEIELTAPFKSDELYVEKKGKVLIKSQFPMVLRVQLI